MDGEGGTRREDEDSGDSLDLGDLPDADDGYDYLDDGEGLDDRWEEISDAAEGSSEESGTEVTKPYVTRFVDGYPDSLSATTEVEVGRDWEGDSPGDFVEIGWLDLNHRVTSKGAAVVDTAKSVMTETGGGDSGLKAYLNTEGIESFFDRVRRDNDVELGNAP